MTRGYRKESLDVLSQELRSALLNLFGSNHGIYRLLGLDQIVAWPTFRRAMTGRTIRLSKGRAIRQRWAEWRTKFLKEPDLLDFELRTLGADAPGTASSVLMPYSSAFGSAAPTPESNATDSPQPVLPASADYKQFVLPPLPPEWDSQ
jgi:hypothetical protein